MFSICLIIIHSPFWEISRYFLEESIVIASCLQGLYCHFCFRSDLKPLLYRLTHGTFLWQYCLLLSC